MKNSPYISVIVPLFNNKKTICDCLNALKNQKDISRLNYEVIVVDDCSTDQSTDIARTLCDKFVKLDKNSGAATARNVGVKKASGELLLFVDSDVILEENALVLINDFFGNNPEISAAVGRYTKHPHDGSVVNAYHNFFTRYHHDLSPIEIDWFWGALGAVKKEAFDLVGGFDERYKGASAEDMELGLSLSQAGHQIRYFPEAMGTHAHHFDLKGMLINDYKKAVLGAKLRFSGDLPQKAPNFGSLANILTVPFLIIILFIALFSIYTGSVYLFLFSCIFNVVMLFLLNRKFYRYLLKHSTKYILNMILLHWLQMII